MTTPEVRRMPPTKPARNAFESEIAGMLVRIEINYHREGTGWGSRFEGERLEVVQARAVIQRVRDHVLIAHGLVASRTDRGGR